MFLCNVLQLLPSLAHLETDLDTATTEVVDEGDANNNVSVQGDKKKPL